MCARTPVYLMHRKWSKKPASGWSLAAAARVQGAGDGNGNGLRYRAEGKCLT
jgi:hypothetical protein